MPRQIRHDDAIIKAHTVPPYRTARYLRVAAPFGPPFLIRRFTRRCTIVHTRFFDTLIHHAATRARIVRDRPMCRALITIGEKWKFSFNRVLQIAKDRHSRFIEQREGTRDSGSGRIVSTSPGAEWKFNKCRERRPPGGNRGSHRNFPRSRCRRSQLLLAKRST